MASGSGSINWWGFSPPLNLLNVSMDKSVNQNYLLLGAGDLRHVMETILALLKRSNTSDQYEPINIYILESRLEVYARMLLQLFIITRESEEVSLNEKTELFLETHGNLLIRPGTKEFIEKSGSELLKMITDSSYLSSIMPFVDVSALKYKEVDFLESIFKFWRNDKKAAQLNGKLFWDVRLRQLLGTRYDSQKGAFDWDYNMRLCDRNSKVVKLISQKDYCQWRESGIAFELREADYSEINKTLISPLALNDRTGAKTVRYGYWGDIVNSPYLAYVLEYSNEESGNEKEQKKNPTYGDRNSITSVAPELAQLYVTKVLYGLATGNTNYDPTTASAASIVEVEEDEDSQEAPDSISNRLAKLMRIHFLPVTAFTDIPRKACFQNFFDVIAVSVSLFHLLDNHFCSSTFRSGAKIVSETGQNMVELTHEQTQKLNEVITERMTSVGCKVVNNVRKSPVSAEKPNWPTFLNFCYERRIQSDESSPQEINSADRENSNNAMTEGDFSSV